MSASSQPPAKVPVTIVTGFLGAGKTTLIRHAIENAGGRRLALIVNEFGDLGVDGDILKSCDAPACRPDAIVELSNGCLCCTVADDFVPAIDALLARDPPPDHIIVETSGLALPKPLVKAFDWPDVRRRLTVDGVIAVVDAAAVAAGRFADDPAALAAQRAADPSVGHDNPLEEVFTDQVACADLVVLNKTDLVDAAALARVEAEIAGGSPRPVRTLRARDGRLPVDVLLGVAARAEDDLAARPSHHDGLDDHEHDDFDTIVVDLPAVADPAAEAKRLADVAGRRDVLRMKGFLAVEGKPMRLLVQGVGRRFSHHYDRAWRDGEDRGGRLVVIARAGFDRAALEADVRG
ncbi:MAG: cobalamin biosynthesis protein CobW [Hyphomicrobiales bacterium]|nr:cobalamin biosynthesis protein CobW [Hyphomicrobiales bacterium]MDE2016125.1 cobalamin biosynthesis protein CobW [Hyphomicrobiales bacterium]